MSSCVIEFQNKLYETILRVVSGLQVATTEVQNLLLPHVPSGVLLRLVTQQSWDPADVMDVIHNLGKIRQELNLFMATKGTRASTTATGELPSRYGSDEINKAFRILERRLYHTYGIMMATGASYRNALYVVMQDEHERDQDPYPIVDLLNRLLAERTGR